MIPQHSSKTVEHFTPEHIVESARVVLGNIDLDPASCAEANAIVRADRWYGPEVEFPIGVDGLRENWRGRVFCNPPGGTFTPKRKSKNDPPVKISKSDAEHREHFETDSRAAAWWRKLCEEVAAGHTTDAIFIGFTLELLRSAQTHGDRERWAHPFDFAICVPRDRLKFGGNSPTHANVIVYVGNRRSAFVQEFTKHGRCKL